MSNDVEGEVNLNLIVGVNNIGGVLEVPGYYPQHQWYLNRVIIRGENQSQITPTASGNYTIEATKTEGCSAFSDPVLAIEIQEQLTPKPAIRSIEAFDIVGRFLGQFRNQEVLINQNWNGNQLLLLQYFYADQNLIGTEQKLTSAF
jgi:hypothetical protein